MVRPGVRSLPPAAPIVTAAMGSGTFRTEPDPRIGPVDEIGSSGILVGWPVFAEGIALPQSYFQRGSEVYNSSYSAVAEVRLVVDPESANGVASVMAVASSESSSSQPVPRMVLVENF